MKRLKINAADIINIVLSLLLTVGSLTFFKSSCMADMHCHQVNTVITGIGGGLLALSVITLAVRGQAKAILAFLSAAVAAVEALVPGVILSLCMMPQMSCRAVMRPWTMLLSVAIAVVSLINGIIKLKK